MAAFGDFAYTIVRGDTLSKLAARFGTTVGAIAAANPQITNVNLILVGQVISIPVPAIAATTPATPEAVSPLQAGVAPGGESTSMWIIASLAGLLVALMYGGSKGGRRRAVRARSRSRRRRKRQL